MELKHCFSCQFYEAYYIRGYGKFEKVDIGRCEKSGSTVGRKFTCEHYSPVEHRRIDVRCEAFCALAEHINVLAEIKQILEQDYEEDELDEWFRDLVEDSRCKV